MAPGGSCRSCTRQQVCLVEAPLAAASLAPLCTRCRAPTACLKGTGRAAQVHLAWNQGVVLNSRATDMVRHGPHSVPHALLGHRTAPGGGAARGACLHWSALQRGWAAAPQPAHSPGPAPAQTCLAAWWPSECASADGMECLLGPRLHDDGRRAGSFRQVRKKGLCSPLSCSQQLLSLAVTGCPAAKIPCW